MTRTPVWEYEPDRHEWKRAGLACTVLRHPEFKHLCGYVDLPEGHPDYGKDYEALDEIGVHGGLTFASERDGAWRVGFDCCHSGDYVPGLAETVRAAMGHTTIMERDTYRNFEYVTAEVNHLAEQLAERGKGNANT